MISDSTCVTSEFWCEVLSMFLLQKFVLRPTPDSLAPLDYDSVKFLGKLRKIGHFRHKIQQIALNCRFESISCVKISNFQETFLVNSKWISSAK